MATRTISTDINSPAYNPKANQEYSRLLTAAVINPQFRHLLLTNPGKAIDSGYGGERFHLGREEKSRVASIQATSLADFASQLMSVPAHGAMVVGD